VTQSKVLDGGFAEIVVPDEEISPLLEMMKARIRRLSHLENNRPDTFAEITRLARICYVLSGRTDKGPAVVRKMSLEDVNAVYVLDVQSRAPGTLRELNLVRQLVRSGPVDPDVSDQAAKSVYEVMET